MNTDKRTFLALALIAAVFFVFQVLFPPQRPKPSTPAIAATPDTAATTVTPSTQAAAPGAPAAGPHDTTAAAALAVRPETTEVRTTHAVYRFTNFGAAPASVEMLDYKATRAGVSHAVALGLPNEPVIRYRLVSPPDTLDLSHTPFTVAKTTVDTSTVLTYTADVRGNHLTITYTLDPDMYLMTVAAKVSGPLARPDTYLFTTLPSSFASAEADTLDDQRHFAFAIKTVRDDPEGEPFAKLDSVERKVVGGTQGGPVSWAAARNKYFVVGLLAPPKTPFAEVQLRGNVRAASAKYATVGHATVLIPVRDGGAAFDLYAGPQEWRRLHALGREFEDVNPYGGWIHGILQPFATLIVRVILWMHAKLTLNYGWVIIIFGIAIRVLLWPLNQRAMRTSMKMQALQPELTAVQERYKNDKDKLQTEMFKVYKEHGLSPFSPVMGCLPMLIPMPILFCLLFVLQNTIEFRGVPFLWLHDISLKDPFYILPLLMGASSYLVSWIGMRNSPPNPQAKMMSYMFPVMMTVFLANVSAGLNLYYAVQNLATLPQQWFLSIERARTGAVKTAAPIKAKTSSA